MSAELIATEAAHVRNLPTGSVPVQSSGGETLQQLVLDIRAGGTGAVLDQLARLHHLSDIHVVSRHLVVRHIEREAQRDWMRELAGSGDDSSAQDKGAERIDGTALRETHETMCKVLARPAAAICPASAFGDLLAQEFAELAAGQLRRYVVCADTHVLALELRCSSSSCMVRLYDPHPTATHLRLVVPHPDRLREPGRRSLQGWLGPVCAEYFEAQPEIVSLHGWEATERREGSSGAPRLLPFDEQAQVSPHFLRRLLLAGATDEVRGCTRQAMARLPAGSGQLVRFLQARSPNGQSGLEAAIVNGQVATAAAYVSSVASAPEWQLSEPNRYLLLRAASRSVQGELPALNADTVRACPEAVVACMRAVLAAPSAALSAEHRIELLLARPTRGAPLLNELCSRAPRLAQEAQAVQEGLYGIAQALAGAHVLSVREQQTVLSAKVSKGWWRSETAAAAAVAAGNAEAAAALACGVFDSRADTALKNALLAAMDLKPGEVLRALSRLPPSRRDRWKPRLNMAIEAHMHPQARPASR